jgi:hypothetical protein
MLCLGTDLEKHIVLGINRLIRVRANHCYGCTAGAGSSCGGAVTEAESVENAPPRR